MSSSSSSATAGPEEQPILIPSLPYELALNCLARVHRSLHPILRLVSKPIRSFVSSTLLYDTRSLINSTQHLLYLCVIDPTSSSLLFFTLNQNLRTHDYIFTPIPSPPSPPTIDSAFAVVGHEIYVLGGSIYGGMPSPHVWVLDCRFHTWEKAPSMLVGRQSAAIGVINTKIYVFGGCGATERNWAEVFDPKTKSWSAVCSEIEFRQDRIYSSGVIGDKIYGMGDGAGVKYDPVTLSWERVECGSGMAWRRGGGCVVNGLFYWHASSGKIRAFDMNNGVIRELRGGVAEDLPRYLSRSTMANRGGNLVVVWQGLERNGSARSIRFAEIEVEEDENGVLWGKICWSGLVLSIHCLPSILKCVGVTL